MESLDGAAVPLTYPAPVATGGTPPVTVTCTPAAGAPVPPGATTVVCTATDPRRAFASCAFAVTVVVPRLSAATFLAFGDSLTYGVASAPLPALIEPVEVPGSYPSLLQAMLRDRYRTQRAAVLNLGIGGERAAGPSVHSPGGEVRLPQALDAHRPDVLLLMEGTNDLNDGLDGAQAAAAALERMVREAKARGVRVLLATVPPAREGTRRGTIARTVPTYNQMIRDLAAREGVVLVDVYAAMDLSLIGVDDLHPTPEGYAVMARTFYNAIRAAFEVRAP